MKFYKYNGSSYFAKKIINNKLTAIYIDFYDCIRFLKNGFISNYKNAAFIDNSGYKEFCLNGKLYGFKYNFTKKSWRRFVKMQVFL